MELCVQEGDPEGQKNALFEQKTLARATESHSVKTVTDIMYVCGLYGAHYYLALCVMSLDSCVNASAWGL